MASRLSHSRTFGAGLCQRPLGEGDPCWTSGPLVPVPGEGRARKQPLLDQADLFGHPLKDV
jgi:hypothetical protein